MDPFQTGTTQCKKEQSNQIQTQKLAFICKMERKNINYTKYILYGLLGVSIVFCVVATIVFFKNRKKTNVQQEVFENMVAPRRIIDPAERARLAEEQKKLRLERLQKLLKKTKYGSSKHKQNQEACCICVEDFTKDSECRETPCHHLFHEDCLMKWVETKLAAPDCPFCRAEIKVSAS